MSSLFPFLRAISEFLLVELWSSCIWALDLIDFFLYWAGQPELADDSFKGSTELAKDSAWNQAPSLSDWNSPGGKCQPLPLPLDSMLGTADGLICHSLFIWNRSPDSTLGMDGGSCNSPFVCNQSPVPILCGLLIQSFPPVQSSIETVGGYCWSWTRSDLKTGLGVSLD